MTPRCLHHTLSLGLSLLMAAGLGHAAGADGTATPAAADDPTLLSLEQLVNTEVMTATRFARSISDAPSAVSVITADDIRLYGFQTLGQILDHMRGLYLSYSPSYVYLGARGYGGDDLFAGRVLLLIDGAPAADGVFDQIYLGDDSLVDPALIDRIEYAPGTGSALYGRNAFVGVIHVITKPGRRLQGFNGSVGLADSGDRRTRLSAGWRHDNGLEWLASVSLGRNDGRVAPEVGDIMRELDSRAHWDRWLFKLRQGEWSAQLMAVERRTAESMPGSRFSTAEANRVLTIEHDTQPAAALSVSSRLTLGDYRYRTDASLSGVGDPEVLESGYRGRWWGAETLWSYEGLAGHRLVAGLSFRHDYRQEESFSPGDGQPLLRFAQGRRSLGLSIEDEVALGERCRGTLGLRRDQPQGSEASLNPRVALACQTEAGWTAKLSHGRATRFASRAEEGFAEPQSLHPESMATTEAVLEGRRDALRWLASLYHYRIQRPVFENSDMAQAARLSGRGAEFELEWQHAGWRLRGSHAWQTLRDADGQRAGFSPRTVTKLLMSAPLDGERARLSATVRHLGSYQVPFVTRTSSRTQLDVMGLWRPDGGRWEWAMGVRNLLDERYRDIEDYMGDSPALTERRNRTLWLTTTWSWP